MLPCTSVPAVPAMFSPPDELPVVSLVSAVSWARTCRILSVGCAVHSVPGLCGSGGAEALCSSGHGGMVTGGP